MNNFRKHFKSFLIGVIIEKLKTEKDEKKIKKLLSEVDKINKFFLEMETKGQWI